MNSVTLVGFVSRDPQATTTKNSIVCKFGLGTREYINGKEDVEWHTITAWGKLAEMCRDHLKKGRQVAIQGRIRTNKWTDESGKPRVIHEILADRLEFVEKKEAQDDEEEKAAPTVVPAAPPKPAPPKPVAQVMDEEEKPKPAAPTVPSAPRKRGRPPGSKNKPKVTSLLNVTPKPAASDDEEEDLVMFEEEFN
jgi:single-strand DNA-binding protein